MKALGRKATDNALAAIAPSIKGKGTGKYDMIQPPRLPKARNRAVLSKVVWSTQVFPLCDMSRTAKVSVQGSGLNVDGLSKCWDG